MKLSITVTDHAWSDGVDGLRRVVELADQGGIDTIWVPDHLFQADPTSHPQAELFEGSACWGTWLRSQVACGSGCSFHRYRSGRPRSR
jgi:alkanesulfonate monooxygenase SsuD/methylene tetrahydromethanopterin reductase-like flavin-dependent oxidoreductase (luciferase family)